MTRQLGLHAYFDPHFFKVMQDRFKKYMPQYLGYESLIPHANTYSLSPVDDGEHLITRDGEGKIHVLRNVCRHQGARLIDERFDAALGDCESGALTCPLHQWTWNLDGTLRGAPEFGNVKMTECRKQLGEVPHAVWGDMIFALPEKHEGRSLIWQSEMQSNGPFAEKFFHLNGLIPDKKRSIHHHDASALIFMNVYCDMRHVRIGHKGTFGSVFDTSTLAWNIGQYHSIQQIGMLPFPNKPGPEYARWHSLTNRILDAIGVEKTSGIFRGVLWGFFYPWLTIEVYPLCTVVSSIIPTGPSSCRNVVQFFWRPELTKCQQLFNEYRECQIQAYQASMREDDEFIERIGSGLRDMHVRGEHFDGLAHKEEEKGILAYRNFLDPVEVAFWAPRPR